MADGRNSAPLAGAIIIIVCGRRPNMFIGAWLLGHCRRRSGIAVGKQGTTRIKLSYLVWPFGREPSSHEHLVSPSSRSAPSSGKQKKHMVA